MHLVWLLVSVSWFSYGAQAANAPVCPPDLSGQTGYYVCTYADGSQEPLTLKQEKHGDVMVYEYNGSVIPADNVAYPFPDDGNLRGATFRAWCDPAAPTELRTLISGKNYRGTAYVGEFSLNMTLSLTGSTLKMVSRGSLKNAGGEYPFVSEVLCVAAPVPPKSKAF